MGVPVRIEGETTALTTVQVVEHNGAPTAMIGETPISLWGRLVNRGERQLRGQTTELATSRVPSSVPILVVPATAAHDPYGWAEDVWLSREVWDYEAWTGR